MARVAYIHGTAPMALWGLDSRERLRRQLAACGITHLLDDPAHVVASDEVLLLNAGYLFEQNTLRALLRHAGSALEDTASAALAAAFVGGSDAVACARALAGQAALPPALTRLDIQALSGYDADLRRSEPLLLEAILPERRAALESRLYGNSYKGITDLVTKWLWPRPARVLVGVCTRLGITPNMVTVTGLLLVIAASFLFAQGAYLSGLVCGWIMTLLDTVDGKLARVTVQSSRLGHWLDHGMDIVHPPIWYVLWGVGLVGVDSIGGFSLQALYGGIVGGYVAGRAIEGAFHALGHCSMFAWRPFDAYFRLITARRNPCLIIMTALALAGQPAWALYGVAAWTVLSSVIMLLRLFYAAFVRLREGPLDSWLKDPARAAAEHAVAYRRFAGTRGAYA